MEVKMQQRKKGKSPFVGMEEPYGWAMDSEWEKVIRHMEFEGNRHKLLTAMTLEKDTVFHVAAARIRRGKDVLKRLFDLLPNDDLKSEALMSYNCHGNIVLHEVAAFGNREAAQLLLEILPECGGGRLLEKANDLGETPVYRAAAFGRTYMVKFFANKIDLAKHFHREADDMSVLHIAVITQHFETALWLQTNFKNLRKKREDKGLTSLQLLAQMPLAFKPRFKHTSKWIAMLIYYCLPVEDDDLVQPNQKYDVESRSGRNQPRQSFRWKKLSVFRMVYFSIWNFLSKALPTIHIIWKEKKNQKSLEKLTHLLVKKDFSWKKSLKEKDTTIYLGSVEDLISPHDDDDDDDDDDDVDDSKVKAPDTAQDYGQTHDKYEGEKVKALDAAQVNLTDQEEQKQINVAKAKRFTPLLTATTTGAVHIVKEILKVHPQAVEHVNDNGHNILHLAIRHRQYEVFKLVRRRKFILSRLASRIDVEGNTILHQVSDSRYYSTADQQINGPAMQLQDELHWVERVQKIIPPHYSLHHNKENKTAVELFNERHKDLLKLAQDWMKDTAQACTVVGVLVATLVFAAAYTVPGGNDPNTGLPIFRDSPFFWIFTIMDIVSLCYECVKFIYKKIIRKSLLCFWRKKV